MPVSCSTRKARDPAKDEIQHEILSERIAEISREPGGRGDRHGADLAKPRRTMGAATRRRMAAVQQKRWAEAMQGSGIKVKKRRTSTEGRRRWEAYRVARAVAQ